MVELEYVEKLLTLLKASGVASYKSGDLELLFHIEQRQGTDAVQDLPTSQLPVDLRTDGSAGYDNLLFHSASPSPIQDEVPLVGLGEEPL